MAHISHIYENLLLTFGEIKDIMTKASKNQLKVYEKTDGQNMLLSYSLKQNKALSARTKNDIISGGYTAEEMSDKFYEKTKIKKTFYEAIKEWEKVISNIPEDSLYDIFGYNANIYYNCEIQNPVSKNVINYDTKHIVIHNEGHWELDKATDEITTRDFTRNLHVLQKALELVESRHTNFNYKLVTKSVYDLQEYLSKKNLNQFVTRLEELQKNSSLSDEDNIYDYVLQKIKDKVDKEIPNATSYVKQELSKKIIGIPVTSDIKTILKTLPKDQRENIKDIITNSKSIMKDITEDLEEIIHEFSVHLLSGLKSLFVLDGDKEIQRLKEELSDTIKKLKSSNDPNAISVLHRQMKKLKSVDRVDTTIEGLVFDYKGKVYKFTGNFAPINQILGLLTYGKVNFSRPVEYSKEKNIVIFPGKFKPPHLGHFLGIRELANIKQIDSIEVIISPKEIEDITAEMSKKIWEIFKKYEPKINITISSEKSPMASTFERLRTIDKNCKVFLTLSEKELENGLDRYKEVKTFVEKHNPGLNVEVIYTEQNKDGITGTYVRELINSGKKEMFFSVLPKELSLEDREEIWNIVYNKSPFVTSDKLKSIVKESVSVAIFRR